MSVHLKKSIRIFLPFAAASLFFCAPPAHAIDVPALEISKPTDLALDCPALSNEITAMRALVTQASYTEEDATLRRRGVGAAGTVASYLVGTLTGTIGIMAAGQLIKAATDDDSETAEQMKDAAKQRRSFIIGLYNAHGCQGPVQDLPPEPGPLIDMPRLEPAAGSASASFRYND